jgi:hypothetical protein
LSYCHLVKILGDLLINLVLWEIITRDVGSRFWSWKVSTLRKLIISIVEIVCKHWVCWSLWYQFLLGPTSLLHHGDSLWNFKVLLKIIIGLRRLGWTAIKSWWDLLNAFTFLILLLNNNGSGHLYLFFGLPNLRHFLFSFEEEL